MRYKHTSYTSLCEQKKKKSQIFLVACFLFWGAALCFVCWGFFNTVSTCHFHLLTCYAPYLIMKDDNELERDEPQPYCFNLCSEGNSLKKKALL